MRHFLAVFVLVACGRSPQIEAPARVAPTAYERQDGLIVHEWGTFTSVMASDGTLLPGLHHEEEDLPGFVADRIAQTSWNGADVYSNEKMETPVTYFYASKAMQVTAQVGFPKGVFTQWFPYVKKMRPWVKYDRTDPWLSTSVSKDPSCPTDYEHPFHDGLLDWGAIEVLEPGVTMPLASPLGETSWGFARQTEANALRVKAPYGGAEQYEKFLFYRGLGNFELPMKATVTTRSATFTNEDRRGELSGLLLMRVTSEGAGFVEVGDLAPGASLSSSLPAATMSHGDFVAALKVKLSERLVKSGLYADEARAMVDTWERAYFLTPGLRLLYLLPQVQTDALIPLAITPAPKELLRTMVIRVELMTPAEEAELTSHLAENDEAYFMAHGRFAEPHLTRALQLMPGDLVAQENGAAMLEVVRAKRRWASLASE